ncbi:hypothetical protein LEMLEM_LOCUS12114 [Lemmus lemmus]
MVIMILPASKNGKNPTGTFRKEKQSCLW